MYNYICSFFSFFGESLKRQHPRRYSWHANDLNMKFQEALMQHTPLQRMKILSFLDEWEKQTDHDQIAVDNVRNEHFMEFPAWASFFQTILQIENRRKTVVDSDYFFIEFKYNLLQAFKESYHLRGGLVSSHCQPVMVGVVLTYDQFIHHLLVYYPQYFTEPAEIIRHIYNMKDFSRMYPQWTEMLLGKADTLTWLVWNKERKDPFLIDKLGREELRDMLGLGGDYFENKSLLAFVFECICDIYRPTFSDSNLSVNFRPYHEDHGMTVPLSKKINKRIKLKSGVKGLPEGVHLSKNFHLGLLKQLYFYQ